MNKKVLGICVILLAADTLSIPVMASSPNKIEVTLTTGAYSDVTQDWELRGNVAHGRNGLMIWEDCVVTGDGIYLEGGILTKTYSYDINVKDSPPSPQRWIGKGVLHYEVEIVFQDGTFKGNHILSGEFRVRKSDGFVRPWNTIGYAVYYGTGTYLGWTWVLIDVSTNGEAVFESYILIPEPNCHNSKVFLLFSISFPL
jgi:hypothetical protein